MKKWIVVIAALILICLSVGTTAYAETSESALLDAEQFVSRLTSLNRGVQLAETSGQADAAKSQVRDMLKEQFRLALGVDASAVKERYFTVETVTGYNIEVTYDAPGTDKCVIIGAHYDAVGEGANDNVSGVATMFEIMKGLKGVSLPFDVYFVAFDCEEDGLVGSTYYTERQIYTEFEDVLVMFNIDSIASGEQLYLMCENKHTDLADMILSKSEEIAEKPYAAGVYGVYDAFGYGYYEYVQGSDHTPFRLQDIPVALFFSGEYDMLGYKGDGMMNTDEDTLVNLQYANPAFLSRISTVASAICATLGDENFLNVAGAARGQLLNNTLLYNRWWPSLVVLGVLLILALCTWLYSRKLKKQAILGHAEVKNNTVFDKPDSEDIFSFAQEQDKNDEKDAHKDDIDDIFTFKK